MPIHDRLTAVADLARGWGFAHAVTGLVRPEFLVEVEAVVALPD